MIATATIPDPDSVVRYKTAVAGSRARILELEPKELAGTLTKDERTELAERRALVARTILSWIEDDTNDC